MFAWRTFPHRAGEATGAYLTVPALARRGIMVAFTTRHGGRSGEPFAALNLSYASGDEAAIVRANRSRALEAVGGAMQTWTGARQVHGSRAVRVGETERGAGWESPATVVPDADALWTDAADLSLVVLTADCTPILLADPDRRRIGVVHAGWRGLVGGVVESAVAAMGEPAGLRAFVGPSIGPCCYEVGPEVTAAARERLGEVVARRGDREHLDLWTGSLVALARAGVREVWPAALCTRCEPDRFYSHRAGARGRQGLVARIAS
jgi:YfiH family protein